MPKTTSTINSASDQNDRWAEWVMVSDKKNGTTYFPKTIPQRRGNMSTWIIFLIVLCFFVGDLLKTSTMENLFFKIEVICYSNLIVMIVELINRVVFLLEELLYHFTPRYGNDYIRLMNHTFSFSWRSIISTSLSFFGAICFFMKHGIISIAKLNEVSLLLTICGTLLLKRIIAVERAPIYDSLKIEEKNGLNYGSGMAYSFFYGYLKLQLSKTGGSEKNLIEEIETYSDQQGVRFPVAKLFILLPKSCFCHVSLKDDIFPNIEESASLGEKIKTVAGVQNRVYKNSVYKIYDTKEKERVYACVEYATPLRTFRLGLESDGPYTKYYKEHSEEIVLQFYLTLKELLHRDIEITDRCDLIYYEDRDERGKFRDVAEIILTRIRKLKKEAKKTK